jgi:hypothetical protein
MCSAWLKDRDRARDMVPRLFPPDADGLCQAPEEGWFFLGGCCRGERFAGRRAIGAEKPRLAALNAKGADTIAAESLLAFRALDDRGDARMEEAGEGTIQEMGLDGLRFALDFRDGDADWLLFFFQIHAQFSGSEAEDLPRFENGLLDGLTIDEGAISGIEVANKDGVSTNNKFTVETGDRRVVNPVVIGRIPAEAGKAIGEFKGSRMGDSG